MFELSVSSKFNSAHNLRNYDGECEALHGHSWKIEVFIKGDKLNNIGLLVDFKIIKKELNLVIEKLDHKYINNIEPFDKINPTAENLAKFIYDSLKDKFILSKVVVWESESTSASYSV